MNNPSKSFALSSLLLGIAALVLFLLFMTTDIEGPITLYIAFAASLVGIVLSIVALVKHQSKVMSILGLVLSVLALLLSLGLLLFALVFVGAI